jgi:hypothetical protein
MVWTCQLCSPQELSSLVSSSDSQHRNCSDILVVTFLSSRLTFILGEGYNHTDFALDSLRCSWTSVSSSGIIRNQTLLSLSGKFGNSGRSFRYFGKIMLPWLWSNPRIYSQNCKYHCTHNMYSICASSNEHMDTTDELFCSVALLATPSFPPALNNCRHLPAH